MIRSARQLAVELTTKSNQIMGEGTVKRGKGEKNRGWEQKIRLQNISFKF